VERTCLRYGFREHLASFKSVGLGVLEFQAAPAETAKRIIAAASEAVEQDMAEVIILGCTMEFGFHQELQNRLGVPVVDAMLAPLKYTEFLVEVKQRLGWSVSKAVEYRTPPLNEIKEWDLEKQYDLGTIW
jgi:allantoin racemase